MKPLHTIAALCLAAAFPAAALHAQLTLPPPGATLPVFLDRTLDAKNARPGTPIRATLAQRVPLPGGAFLPDKAKLTGTLLSADGQALTLRFDTLVLGEQAAPIHVRLLAAADWLDVEHTYDNLGSPDRGEGNPTQWTTEQIGGDEVYRANSIATVYNRVSEPVGRADGTGVYGAPLPPAGSAPANNLRLTNGPSLAQSPGLARSLGLTPAPAFTNGLERAMGPFSTTSTGLYDLPGLTLPANSPPNHPPPPPDTIQFGITDSKWRLHAHSALLLEVQP